MPYCPFTARWQLVSNQIKNLQSALLSCADPNRKKLIQNELNVKLITAQNLRENIQAKVKEQERYRISQGGSVKRIPGQLVSVVHEPSDNYRDEIISQMHSHRAHSKEDKILFALMAPVEVEKEEIKESNRKCGIELEVTGVSRDQLTALNRSLTGGAWNIVGDGTIPSVRNICEHRREYRKCKYCDKKQEECNCCGQVYTCSNSNCGCSFHLADLEKYRRDKNNSKLRCKQCKTLINLVANPCECLHTSGICTKHADRFRLASNNTPCRCPEYWKGGECVSQPGYGEKWLNTAKVFYDGIVAQAEKNNANAWHREGDAATGFHVHVEGSGLTKEQMALIVILFDHQVNTFLKNEHKNILPEWRTNNFPYCKTNWLGGSDKNKVTLTDIYDQNRGDRYRQVNLSAMSKHGTVEFRLGFLPQTGQEVVNWVKACKAVVDKVCSIPPEEMKELKTYAEGHEVMTYKPLTEWLEKLDDMPVMNAIFNPFRKFTCHI